MRSKAVLVCLVGCVASLLMINGYGYCETIDRIVAVVNDEPITKSELDSMLLPIYEQYSAVYAGDEFIVKMNEARANILSQLIDDRLVSQEAKRLGVIVAEEEIDQQMRVLIDKFPSQEEFRSFLKQQNMTQEKIRKRYADQIASQKLHQFEVRQKVIVSPKDIETYYEEHIADFTEKEKIKVKTIMVKKKEPTEEGGDEARALIDDIVAQLKAGANFAELAKQYSEESHAKEGGELGFVRRGEMIDTFDTVLFSLSVGEISSVLETEIGYHLFLVDAKQGKKVTLLAEVKDDIREIIFRTKAKERFAKWMKELKENAYISIK